MLTRSLRPRRLWGRTVVAGRRLAKSEPAVPIIPAKDEKRNESHAVTVAVTICGRRLGMMTAY